MDEESQAAYCLLAMSRAAERDFNALSAALGHRTVMEQQSSTTSSSATSSTFPAATTQEDEDRHEEKTVPAAAAVGDPSQFMIARILSDLTRVRQVFNVQQAPTQGMHTH